MRPPRVPEVVPEGVPGRTKAERVRAMFARIVPRYDLMNRLMTLGMDGYWRKVAARLARPGGALALDVGTGTGDFALTLTRAGASRVVGVDFVEEMLRVARGKIIAGGAAERVAFVQGDALVLPFPAETFDCVVNGFLLRNVGDLSAAFREMNRVLKPGGRLVCLEITHPPVTIAPLFRFYFERMVPVIGGLITGEGAAYRYLPASLVPLPDPNRLTALIQEVGLVGVRYRRVGFGLVAIHSAEKPG